MFNTRRVSVYLLFFIFSFSLAFLSGCSEDDEDDNNSNLVGIVSVRLVDAAAKNGSTAFFKIFPGDVVDVTTDPVAYGEYTIASGGGDYVALEPEKTTAALFDKGDYNLYFFIDDNADDILNDGEMTTDTLVAFNLDDKSMEHFVTVDYDDLIAHVTE